MLLSSSQDMSKAGGAAIKVQVKDSIMGITCRAT